ncbi:MAG: TssA family type VI secretion system protein [Deltaproteobacteria bacterium]|jgi:type VI secretion system protein VasJ|nr:TssA family type VI secretion system protein [Deltaproteobacteria bacterium]
MDISGLGRDPVPGDVPAGRDARLEDKFFQVQAEIDRLNSLSLAEEGGIRWPKVAELAAGILREDSKDILPAVYLSVSLLETEGPVSLAASSSMLKDLITTFWETMHPPLKRPRARVNAIDWWKERAAGYLKKYEEPPLDSSVIEEIRSSLSLLDAALKEKKLPGASDVIKLLDRLPVIAEAPVAESPPAEEREDSALPPPFPSSSAASPPPSSPPPSAPPPSSPPPSAAPITPAPPTVPPASPAPASPAPEGGGNPPEPAAPADEGEALAALGRSLGNYLEFKKDAFADPLYYRVSRARLWLPVKTAPPAENGLTLVRGPDKETASSLRALLEKGSHAELLRAAEDLFGAYLFWLDPHYLAGRALAALSYKQSAEELKLSCLSLLNRIPSLKDLSFADGTPFASPETLAWLEGGSSSASGEPEAGGKDYRELSLGDPAEALKRVNLPENAPRAGRGRLEKAISEAGAWLRLERPRTALSLAAYAEELLEKHALMDYDPDLSAEALKVIYKVYLSLGPAFQERARNSLNLLARLKPTDILKMPKPDDE